MTLLRDKNLQKRKINLLCVKLLDKIFEIFTSLKNTETLWFKVVLCKRDIALVFFLRGQNLAFSQVVFLFMSLDFFPLFPETGTFTGFRMLKRLTIIILLQQSMQV